MKVYWSKASDPDSWEPMPYYWFPYAERLCRWHPAGRWVVLTYAKVRLWLQGS